jgi:AAA+ superfamily predicted ATPase
MNVPHGVGDARLIDPFDRSAARAVFDLELQRLDLLIHREILRLRVRYELTLDEFRGLYISDQQVDELIRAARHEPDADAVDALTRKANFLAETISADAPRTAATPWRKLCVNLKLSLLERDVLLTAYAPELDAKYGTLYAYLNNDVTRKLPTADLAGRLLADDVRQRVDVRALLTPASRLVQTGLIEFIAAQGDPARAHRGYRLASPVTDWLLGLPYYDEHLSGCAALVRAADIDARALCAEAARAARVIARGKEVPSIVCLAPAAEDAAGAARDIQFAVGRAVLRIDLGSWRVVPAPSDIGAAAILMASVFDVGIVASPLDALFDAEGRMLETPSMAARRLAEQTCQVIWAGSHASRWREIIGADADRACVVHLPELDVATRADVWRRRLGTHADMLDVDALADRFIFGPERIARVVDHVLDRVGPGAVPLTQADLFDAARRLSAERVVGVTRTIESPFTWDDLVLPATVKRRLHDVVRAIALRPRVLDQWGFATRLANARGVKVMFAGASGTGKTMAASIVAKTLSLDTHRIELAAVVSKYIGETEKNLDRAFDTARRANAILFIDEADALFGKRSEVKDAHDRYANVETAYLLQKMEDHDGIVILATNLANNIDEAFSRRMQFVIDFPMPDVASREKLWRGMFPPLAPLAADLDIPFLARQFTLAGGDIRNVVLDAAYLAAQEDQSIGMRHLLNAVAHQYAKRGKVPTATEFREYFALLGQVS